MKATEILDQVTSVFFEGRAFALEALDRESLAELKTLDVQPTYFDMDADSEVPIENRGKWGIKFQFLDREGKPGELWTSRKIAKTAEAYLAIQAGKYI